VSVSKEGNNAYPTQAGSGDVRFSVTQEEIQAAFNAAEKIFFSHIPSVGELRDQMIFQRGVESGLLQASMSLVPLGWLIDGPKARMLVHKREDIDSSVAKLAASVGDDLDDYTATELFAIGVTRPEITLKSNPASSGMQGRRKKP
jgi:hypothetical protein